MATNLVAEYNGKKESINLEQTESETQPTTAIEAAANDYPVIHNIIDNNKTIKDPGYLDLTQLTALKDVQPQAPGGYAIPTEKVEFTDAEKATLEACIKKLAEVAHRHTMSIDSSNTSQYCTNSCDNMVGCLNHANNSYSSHGDRCDDNGQW